MTADREIYFEFIQIGRALKVIAVDSVTGTEVSIVGDPAASQSNLEAVAAAKLKRALNKERNLESNQGVIC